MELTLTALCACYAGCERERNEDNFYFNKKHLPQGNKGLKEPIKCTSSTSDGTLFAVFDGMGGGCEGGKASFSAAEVFSEECKRLSELAVSGKEFFFNACKRAGEEINAQREQLQLSVMGTTVAALYFSGDEVVCCNVGDSKIYRIREKRMLQISQDHTDGKIIELMGIKKKPVLLQYLGMPSEEGPTDPFIARGDARVGDIFVICTDGVTDVLDASRLYDIICNDTERAGSSVMAEIKKLDGSDNATLIVIRVS